MVTADGQAPRAASEGSARPQLITREADDDFPGLYALRSGTLVVTDDDCIAVATGDGQRPSGIVWGHGWSAARVDGRAVLYDAGGSVIAREGDRIQLGGGGGGYDEARNSRHPCWTDDMWTANDSQVPQPGIVP